MSALVLEARKLVVARGKTLVLRDLSLGVKPGEIVGLLGPSGAGKSTLFGALSGELPLHAGDVLLSGSSLGTRPLHARARLGLSYLPQGPSVLHDLSVRANLRTFSRLAGLALSDGELDRTLERFALAERRDVTARELSGGERRRLELARATLRKPLVLLADEPFAGMDPRSVTHLGEHLRLLASEGLAILVSDHRAHEVLALAHRALLLVDGGIFVDRAAAAFLADEAVSSRYLSGARGA